jgi:predicted dehydrogenase
MLDGAGGGRPHQVGLVLRHSPIFTVMKDDDRPGARAAHGRRPARRPVLLHPGPLPERLARDYEVAGGGALIGHSIHDLDLLTWLLGDVEAVAARTRNFAGHPGIEDLASVWLRFRNGAEGHLVSVWHNVLSRPSLRHMEVFWENGYFTCDQDMFGELRYQTCATSDGVLSPDEVRAVPGACGASPDRAQEAPHAVLPGGLLLPRDLTKAGTFAGFEVACAPRAGRRLPAIRDRRRVVHERAVIRPARRSRAGGRRQSGLHAPLGLAGAGCATTTGATRGFETLGPLTTCPSPASPFSR